MSKSKPTAYPDIKSPSQRAIEIVMSQAANAPIQNLAHAAQVDKAFAEVGAFFRALYPQSTKPQASANGSGKVSDQAQPSGRPA